MHKLSKIDWKPQMHFILILKKKSEYYTSDFKALCLNADSIIWYNSFSLRMEIFCWLPIQDLIEHKLYFLFLICEPKMLGFIGVNPAMFGARLMPHSPSKYTVSNQREASRGAPGDSRRPMLFSMMIRLSPWCWWV